MSRRNSPEAKSSRRDERRDSADEAIANAPERGPYGEFLADAHRAIRDEPRIEIICKHMRLGILGHPWTKRPGAAAFLEGVRLRDREKAAWAGLAKARTYQEEQLEALARHNHAVVTSPEYGAMSRTHQEVWQGLFRRSQNPGCRDTEVLLAFKVMTGMMFQVFGRVVSSTYLCRVVKDLRDAGFLDILPGVAYEGWEQCRANRYSLLPAEQFIRGVAGTACTPYEPGGGDTADEQAADHDPGLTAQVNLAVERCIERVRALKRLYLETGRPVTDADMYFDGPPGTVRNRPRMLRMSGPGLLGPGLPDAA